MAARACRIRAVQRQRLSHRKDLTGVLALSRQRRNIRRRRRRRRAKEIAQHVLPSEHGRRAVRIGRDRENTRVPQQTQSVARIVVGIRDAAEVVPEYVRNAVMPGEPFVHERVVGAEEIDDAAILAKHAFQKQGRFALEGFAQAQVEIREQARARRLRLHVAQIQPLRCEVGGERCRTRIAQHPAHLLIQDRLDCSASRALQRRAVRHPGCCSTGKTTGARPVPDR